MTSHIRLILPLLLAATLARPVCAQDLELRPARQTGGMPLMEVLARRATAREFESRDLAPQQIADLLWACFGMNRPDGKRTAPSTKNSQETDLYVFMKAGAYRYDAKAHKLQLIVAEDLRRLATTQDFATNAPLTLLFVADLARMDGGAKDENLAYAHIDVGYISQNAYLYCASEGLVTGARASFDRKGLESRLKLRPEQRVILAQSVGYPKK